MADGRPDVSQRVDQQRALGWLAVAAVLAIAWLASHRQVASVIAGATSPEQVRQNVSAASWRLTDADMAAIDKIAPAT